MYTSSEIHHLGTREKEESDKDIIQTANYELDRLNKKYSMEGKTPIFNFVYRKRLWNKNEKCYMGWERKRGLLTELNCFLQDRKFKNTFLINTLEKSDIKVKYIITLDLDTELTLNSGIELIGAMAHPLNKPVIDNRNSSRWIWNNAAKNWDKFRK